MIRSKEQCKESLNDSPKSILLTGCAGFIGSNFVPYFLKKYPDYHLINLDLLTYAGDLENLKEVNDQERYTFIQGDIRDRKLVESLFQEHDIRGVIHFAAESHVDNSIKNPGIFIETNINGTFTLLDAAYKYWMDTPFKYKDTYSQSTQPLPRFHHISTDEVYGTLGEDRAGHDRRYAIDASKIETELGWKADENFESGIIKTVEWYLTKYNS